MTERELVNRVAWIRPFINWSVSFANGAAWCPVVVRGAPLAAGALIVRVIISF